MVAQNYELELGEMENESHFLFLLSPLRRAENTFLLMVVSFHKLASFVSKVGMVYFTRFSIVWHPFLSSGLLVCAEHNNKIESIHQNIGFYKVSYDKSFLEKVVFQSTNTNLISMNVHLFVTNLLKLVCSEGNALPPTSFSINQT